MPKNQPATERGSSDPVHLTLRFDEDLRQQLAEAANHSVRSLNGEIIFRLKTSFQHNEVGA
jgi:predicted HicB family RNase H-like nuclease